MYIYMCVCGWVYMVIRLGVDRAGLLPDEFDRLTRLLDLRAAEASVARHVQRLVGVTSLADVVPTLAGLIN